MERPGTATTISSAAPGSFPEAAQRSDAAAAASGDARAFERLYRAHLPRVHSLIRRMLSAEEAGEVTQDVFVRAWEKIGTYRGEAAFGTWLYRLAVNVALSRRAAHGLRRERFDPAEGLIEALPTRPAGTDFGLDFDSAIERLPEGARQVFVLHDIEGYRHEEIARLMGVTSGTTKAQLHRARMLLRGHLGA